MPERDVHDAGLRARAPATSPRWLTAHAATATHETIRAMASAGDGAMPARSTTLPHRDALTALHLLDPPEGWTSVRTRIARASPPPKHHLADPALAARLPGCGADDLMAPAITPVRRCGTHRC